MSDVSQVLNNGQQAIFQYNTEKIFLGSNRYKTFDLNNASGASKTFPAGLVMGQIAATGKIVPCVSTANDGSQYPIGILNQDITLANGADANVQVCTSGDVNINAILFDNVYDSLTTVISGQTFQRRIGTDTVGVNLMAETELTEPDNQ